MTIGLIRKMMTPVTQKAKREGGGGGGSSPGAVTAAGEAVAALTSKSREQRNRSWRCDVKVGIAAARKQELTNLLG